MRRNGIWKTFLPLAGIGSLAVIAASNIDKGPCGSPAREAAYRFFGRGAQAATAPQPSNPPSLPMAASERTPGDALADNAMRLYAEYGNMPYVWGGESFKSHEETVGDPMYRGVSVTRTQPAGSWRAGLPTFDYPTGPGIDCSAAVWLAAEGTGANSLQKRKSADYYRRHSNKVLAPGTYTVDEITAQARRGDLLFVMDGKRTCHVAIYLGNGMLFESAGREEPDYVNIPASEWKAWREIALPRGKTDWDRGGLQISPVSRYANDGYTVALNSIYRR